MFTSGVVPIDDVFDRELAKLQGEFERQGFGDRQLEVSADVRLEAGQLRAQLVSSRAGSRPST